MKVLQQLIGHFWRSGALNLDEAHYLVAHGFVDADDLPDYSALPEEVEEADEPSKPDAFDPPTDEFELAHEELATRPTSGGGRCVKAPVYDVRQLHRDLSRLMAERRPFMGALAELGSDAVAIRQAGAEEFRRVLTARTRLRPMLLGDVWECVDDAPFDALVADDAKRGPVSRGFRRLLQTGDATQWGGAAKLLKLPEVRTVVNLMAVRRLLLSAVAAMHVDEPGLLARCLQRPPRPGPNWRNLAFGMVLLHNARARGHAVNGYPLVQQIDAATWRRAWATALALNVSSVSRLMAKCFGPGVQSLVPVGESGMPFFDHDLNVPFGWKV